MSGPRHREHIPIATTVMKTDEVARYLRVDLATIYRMLKRKELPCFRIGSEWRFNREQIDAWRFSLETARGR